MRQHLDKELQLILTIKLKFDSEENRYIFIETASSQNQNPQTNSTKLDPIIGSTMVLEHPCQLIVARNHGTVSGGALEPAKIAHAKDSMPAREQKCKVHGLKSGS